MLLYTQSSLMVPFKTRLAFIFKNDMGHWIEHWPSETEAPKKQSVVSLFSPWTDNTPLQVQSDILYLTENAPE